MQGKPLLIETREQREAINRKDFNDEMQAPVPYTPEWAGTMNKHGDDPHLVLTPALHTGHFFGGSAPEDERYVELVTQAQAGKIECQFATIAMAMIRPYSDYRPVISGEHKEEFDKRYETADELTLTAYEYEPGHFMVSGSDDNYATYLLYRRVQPLYVRCMIVGPYTKTWAVGEIDKPFKISLSPQAGYNPEKTARMISKRLCKLMEEKGIYLGEFSRQTGIDVDELHHILDESHSQVPTIEQLERITRVLGVKLSDITPF